MRKLSFETTHDAAVYYTGSRARTCNETRKYLREHGYPDDEIEASIARLREVYLLDDDEYAREYICAKQSIKPVSRRSLEMKLREHLLDEFTIEDALADFDDETETANAQALAALLCARCRVDDDSTEREIRACQQKMIRRLMSNGFGYETTKTAVTLSCGQCRNIDI